MIWQSNNLVGVSVSSLSDIVERRDVLHALLEIKFKVSRHHFDSAVTSFLSAERSRIGCFRWLANRLTPPEVLLVLRRLETHGHVVNVESDMTDEQDTFKACFLNKRTRAAFSAFACLCCPCKRVSRPHPSQVSAVSQLGEHRKEAWTQSPSAHAIPAANVVSSVSNEAAFAAAWRTMSVERLEPVHAPAKADAYI
jgi:hypothetical protein